MEITQVRIHLRDEEKLKAYVTLIFDDSFAIRNVKVIEGNNGLFVAMPSRKRKDGTFQDVAHPLNNEMRETIEKQVLEAYKKELAQSPARAGEKEESLPKPEVKSEPEVEETIAGEETSLPEQTGLTEQTEETKE